jgi:hypothetical protein
VRAKGLLTGIWRIAGLQLPHIDGDDFGLLRRRGIRGLIPGICRDIQSESDIRRRAAGFSPPSFPSR